MVKHNKLLFLNSQAKKEGETDTNFSFELDNSQDFRGPHYVSLHKASIPNSFYTFPLNENGKEIAHAIRASFGGTIINNRPIIFTASNSYGGSPNAFQLATEFQTYLNLLASDAGSANTYTVVYDDVIGKYRIERTAGTDPWVLDFNADPLQYDNTSHSTKRFTAQYLAQALGFPYDFQVTVSGALLTSKNVADVSGTRTIRVVLEGAMMRGIHQNDIGAGSDVLQTIQNTQNSFEIISYNTIETEDSRRYASDISSVMRIRLIDDLNNDLDLNGLSWRATLLFQKVE